MSRDWARTSRRPPAADRLGDPCGCPLSAAPRPCPGPRGSGPPILASRRTLGPGGDGRLASRSPPAPSGREGGAAPYVIVLESNLARVLLGSRSHSTTSSLPAWGWGCGGAQRLACVQIHLAPGTQQSHKARWRRACRTRAQGWQTARGGAGGWSDPGCGCCEQAGRGPWSVPAQAQAPSGQPGPVRAGQGSARGPAGARAVKRQRKCAVRCGTQGGDCPPRKTTAHASPLTQNTSCIRHPPGILRFDWILTLADLCRPCA